MSKEHITIATGESVSLDDMIDNPEKYGFQWGIGAVEKPAGTVVGMAPFRVNTPELLDRYIEVFGAQRVVAWLKGGAKVADQKIREKLATNINLRNNLREMKAIVIRSAFGIVTQAAQTTVYVEKRVTVYVSEDNNFESEDKAQVAEYNRLARAADEAIEAADQE